jgi:mannose-1-phosphate guanylyltransferase
MAGGVGRRFWPLSRSERPKQLLDLFGDGALLAVTAARVAPLTPPKRQVIVTSTTLGPACRRLLPDLPAANLLAEPVGKNTAAAVGWAALHVRRRDPDGVLMVLPADHHIADVAAYRDACAKAVKAARAGRIVTLGIEPTRPETGYGYINRTAPLGGGLYAVAAFKEKPDPGTARDYLADGDYLWNAGMFFLRAQVAIDELTRFEPELMAALSALDVDDPSAEAVASVYPTLKSISIDYAVMERSDKVAVLPGDFGWSDVGSWRSLWDFRPAGASTFARGDVYEIDGGDNVLLADGGTVAVVGVRDLIVVHTADATLVCPREQAQRLREVVAALEADRREGLL